MPQIDNAAYAVGLSECVRARVEEFGRVQPRDTEAAVLVRTKAVHMVLLVVAVPAMVWSGKAKSVFFVPFFAFWLGGVPEAVVTPGAGGREGHGRRQGHDSGPARVSWSSHSECSHYLDVERSGCGRKDCMLVQAVYK